MAQILVKHHENCINTFDAFILGLESKEEIAPVRRLLSSN